MPNNVIMRRVEVTPEYRPLSEIGLVATVDISTPPTNSGLVFFQGDTGEDIPWVAGEYHSFRSVNLAEIRVKGTPGDLVTLIGGTWRE